MEDKKACRVCVTGASGFIGSWLVKKLLEKGYLVHATLRNLGDNSKTGILKNLPGAETRLFLFEADIYEAEGFEPAIQGCQYVFLVATPLQHNQSSSKYKDTCEASLDAAKNILQICERIGTVKRIIYTGSVTATSPLKVDGSGLGDSFDESTWTPLKNISFAHCEENEKWYTESKTQTEKELLKFNSKEKAGGVEVVSLACALVGGDTVLSYVPGSTQVILSPLGSNQVFHRQLKFLQALLGTVPLVHIDDVCEAHIFCIEKPSLTGRFICSSECLTMQEMLDYYEQKYADLVKNKEIEKEPEIRIKCTSTRLLAIGFKYKYDAKKIIDDSVECAKRLGML